MPTVAHECYRELINDGLKDIYLMIVDSMQKYLVNIESSEEVKQIDFIDFYDALDNDLKIQVLFSKNIQVATKHDFEIYKDLRIDKIVSVHKFHSIYREHYAKS